MRVLIFDSRDSFTYNIVECLRTIGISSFHITQEQTNLKAEVEASTHIILGPGHGLPHDHPGLFKILDLVDEQHSVLGICLGHEALAQHFGAKLKQLDRVFHGDLAQIIPMCINNPLFDNIPVPFQAGLYHSWIVDESTLPDVFTINCRSELGLVMGIKHRARNLFGFQFHPESYRTNVGVQLIRNWIESTLVHHEN